MPNLPGVSHWTRVACFRLAHTVKRPERAAIWDRSAAWVRGHVVTAHRDGGGRASRGPRSVERPMWRSCPQAATWGDAPLQVPVITSFPVIEASICRYLTRDY